MNLFNRVLINMKRRKGRVLLMFLLVLIIGFLMASAVIVQTAINASISQLQGRIPLVFSTEYRPGWEDIVIDDFWNDFTFPAMMDRDLVEAIGRLPYVRHFDYTVQTPLWGAYHPFLFDEMDMEENVNELPHFPFTLRGVSTPRVIYIENGLYELYAGRTFTEAEITPHVDANQLIPILVSREVAELNGWFVGEIIELLNLGLFSLPENANVPEGGFTGLEWGEALWEHPYNDSKDVSYHFEIIGLFEFQREHRGNVSQLPAHQSNINLFFLPNWRVHDILLDEVVAWEHWADVFNMHDFLRETRIRDGLDGVTALWVLGDSRDELAFIDAAHGLLPPYSQIMGLSDMFRPMIVATNALRQIVVPLFWMASVAMVVLLTLLILLYMSGRKREIGIYLALGEKKHKICQQFLLEVFLVSIFALSCALLMAHGVAKELALSMIQNEIIADVDVQEIGLFGPNLFDIGIAQTFSTSEMIETFNVSLSTPAAGLFFGSGLITVVLASIVPIVYLFEISPKDILSQAKIE
ncbi:MAG: ABC transporter permease [Defluviitaleaceae bacterium]|nr:ABC transporter permease [Defluviitaleaceae bacterium]